MITSAAEDPPEAKEATALNRYSVAGSSAPGGSSRWNGAMAVAVWKHLGPADLGDTFTRSMEPHPGPGEPSHRTQVPASPLTRTFGETSQSLT